MHLIISPLSSWRAILSARIDFVHAVNIVTSAGVPKSFAIAVVTAFFEGYQNAASDMGRYFMLHTMVC
jgi:hypothetical protein